ncbi:Rv3654c family TadE-like protein [uncultured Tessaracoccus sp.]|uniref:Rv3654c family TadE-like protein n=1 Tax=uncultured Tessaracoccus sp. TaxID=905023 RepID=UPI0025EE3FFE|nr:Rv3654c family TadE-like protein [uncultured Tessaracoccus sp.]
MRRDERGVGTVLTAGIAVVMLVVASVVVLCVGWFATIRRAEQVAEFAALAGASAAVDGREACDAARAAARRNHTAVSRCVVRGTGADVVVEVGVRATLTPRLPGMPEQVQRLASAATM